MSKTQSQCSNFENEIREITAHSTNNSSHNEYFQNTVLDWQSRSMKNKINFADLVYR